jgi:LacI family transcriptional regulator
VTTIVDVARASGVSISTVSRVLNASEHPVSEEARRKVLEAIAALNYSPNALARAMITQDTHIVGMIVEDNQDPFFATIVRGAEDVARMLGFLIIVCNSERDPAIELQYLSTLNDYRVDGVVFTGGGLTDPGYVAEVVKLLEPMRQRHCAIVALACQAFPCLQVSNDNTQAVADATRYLLQLGHRRICYISGPPNITTTELRLNGYAQALHEAGLAPDDELVLVGNYTFEAGQAAAQQVLAMQQLPSAILASTDQMAIGCTTALKAVGLSIPKDVSVMGIDDIAAVRWLDPPLTTVSMNMYELGASGIEILAQCRSGEIGDTVQHLIPHEVIVRQSTARVCPA